MKKLNIFLAALVVTVFAPAASAYIPPSQFIVKTIAKKHAGIKGLRVWGKVTGTRPGETVPSLVFKTVSVYQPGTGVMRVWIQDEKGLELFAAEKNRSAEQFSPLWQLLVDDNADLIMKRLKEVGLPIKTEAELLALPDEAARQTAEEQRLKRLKNVPAWVTGAEDSAPQLWVEKDTFVPLRLWYSKPGSADIVLENTRYAREVPFPRLLKFNAQGFGYELQEEVSDVRLVGEHDLKELKGALKAGFTEAGNASAPELKDAIRIYLETIR